MSIQSNVEHERARQAAQQSTALRCAANAVFHHLIDTHDKAQVLAAVRACAQGRANAAQHKELLAERAHLISTFHVFRSLVLEDLRAAYDEGRLNKSRSTKNRRLSWLALYKPFAALRGIDKALAIEALDRSGNYQCALVEREVPDLWHHFVKLGASYGITEAQLMALYQRAQEQNQKRA